METSFFLKIPTDGASLISGSRELSPLSRGVGSASQNIDNRI